MLNDKQLGDLESIVLNLVRVGKVDVINPGGATARVVFEDRDDMQSYDLRVLKKNTLKNKDSWSPDINEEVVCIFLPTGLESGFILGSYNTDENPPPDGTENKRSTVFEDGTRIEYDRKSSTLLADLGTAKIEASKSKILLQVGANGIEITAGGVSIIGAMTQTGGDITSDGKSLQHHTHSGVQAGPSDTGEPN